MGVLLIWSLVSDTTVASLLHSGRQLTKKKPLASLLDTKHITYLILQYNLKVVTLCLQACLVPSKNGPSNMAVLFSCDMRYFDLNVVFHFI
jgi:hypothetical protein